jgi:hypothetical protein
MGLASITECKHSAFGSIACVQLIKFLAIRKQIALECMVAGDASYICLLLRDFSVIKNNSQAQSLKELLKNINNNMCYVRCQ